MNDDRDWSLDALYQKRFPSAYIELLHGVLDPSPPFSLISNLLGEDPGLSETVLLAAGAFACGRQGKIKDIARAAVVMGTAELAQMTIAFFLQKALRPLVPRTPETRFADGRLTVWSALAARILAKELAPKQCEEAFLAGFLKDTSLFLAFCRPSLPAFLSTDAPSLFTGAAGFERERSAWGADHAELAARQILAWGLPASVAEAVRLHHAEVTDDLPPVARCTAAAVRWAEHMHAPEGTLSGLISFELFLASEFGLGKEKTAELRIACAQKFNAHMESLGSHPLHPGKRLYDLPASLIQDYYFLAMECGSFSGGKSTLHSSEALAKNLRVHWGITDWELTLWSPESDAVSLIRCVKGSLRPEISLSASEAMPRSGRPHVRLEAGMNSFGFLSYLPPADNESFNPGALASFLYILALRFEERARMRIGGEGLDEGFRSLPVPMVKVDARGHIRDATQSFLDSFSLSKPPAGITVKGLLDSRLGISLPYWKDVVEGKNAVRGWFLSAPEGHYPAIPLYAGMYASQSREGEYHLVLGDVTNVSPMQVVSLSHPSYMEGLFNTLTEQVYLMDSAGNIFWTPPNYSDLEGKNFFDILQPQEPGLIWNSDFLRHVMGMTRLRVSFVQVRHSSASCSLVLNPLPDNPKGHWLFTLRPDEDNTARNVPAAVIVDSLTGLACHSHFHSLLEREMNRSHRTGETIGLIFGDIDGFRTVNEMYGFKAGDVVLRRVASAFLAAARPGKDYACRFGGDEFTLLLGDASEALVEDCAERISALVKESCKGAVELSMGLTLLRTGDSPEPRLQMTAQACKRAAGTAERRLWVR